MMKMNDTTECTKRAKGTALLSLLLCLCLLLLLLSGCGSQESDADAVSIRNSFAESEENIRKAAPPDLALPDTVKTISAEDHFYDLTDALPRPEGMVLWDYAAPERGRLLLLYSDAKIRKETIDDSNRTACHLSIISYDLLTGESEVLTDHRDSGLTASELPQFYPRFVSLDPLIICETLGGVFYDQTRDRVTHLDLGTFNHIYRFLPQNNGHIYFTDSTLKIQELCIHEDDMQIETRWSPEEGCICYEPYMLGEDEVILSALPELDPSVSVVYYRVKLSTGQTREIYTAEYELSDSATGTQNGYLATSYFGAGGLERLRLKTKDGLQYELKDPSASDPAPADIDDDKVRLPAVSITNAYGFSFWGYGSGIYTRFFSINDGCLYGDFYNDNNTKLLMWVYDQTEPAKITEPEHTPYQPIKLSEIDLPKLEKELENSLGIRIYTGTEAETDFDGYTAVTENDKAVIYHALLQIQSVYGKFPKGFFEQLNTGGIPLRIHIVHTLTGVQEGTVSTAAGLMAGDFEGPYIVFATDGSTLDEETIYHETAHAIHDKLINDGFTEGFEEEWAALNPPDFEYSLDYDEDHLPDTGYTTFVPEDTSLDSIYFIREYSKTFQTEDIADLFANLMIGEKPSSYYSGIHMQAKCSCFFQLIRKGFDTTGWPEETEWEKRLAEAAH